MNILYSPQDFNNAKPKDPLPLKCETCTEVFYRTKHEIQRLLNPNQQKDHKRTGKHCSKKCTGKHLTKKRKVKCLQCDSNLKSLLDRKSVV